MDLTEFVKNTFIHIRVDEENLFAIRTCRSEPDLLVLKERIEALHPCTTGSTMTDGSEQGEQSMCGSTSVSLEADAPQEPQETLDQSDTSLGRAETQPSAMAPALLMHQQGRCKPCWFHSLGDGCVAGDACGLCHYCGAEEARQARRTDLLFPLLVLLCADSSSSFD